MIHKKINFKNCEHLARREESPSSCVSNVEARTVDAEFGAFGSVYKLAIERVNPLRTDKRITVHLGFKQVVVGLRYIPPTDDDAFLLLPTFPIIPD